MAQKVNVVVESDLSGAAGAETILFGLHGRQYEIDLTDKEQGDLEKALKKFIEVSRVQTKKGLKPAKTAVGPSPATVRAWAVANGLEVPARGRIPEAVVAQFREAN
jgi:Lsr2